MRHALGVALAGAVAACTTFGGASPSPGPQPADAAVADAPSELPDAGFCTNAGDGPLFCEDFETDGPVTARWSETAPVAGTMITKESFASHGGAARVKLPDAPGSNCAYGWLWTTRTGLSATTVTLSFKARVERIAVGGNAQIAYVSAVDDSDAQPEPVEHYLLVDSLGKIASYKQRGAGPSLEPELRETAKAVSSDAWTTFAMRIDLSSKSVELSADDTLLAAHPLELAPPKVFKVTFGIGFACSAVGGTVDYDDVTISAQ